MGWSCREGKINLGIALEMSEVRNISSWTWYFQITKILGAYIEFELFLHRRNEIDNGIHSISN